MAEKQRLPDSMAALPNVSALMSLIEKCEARAEHLPGIGVYFGRAGLGKTSAATCAAIVQDVVHLEVRAIWNGKTLLLKIALELGLKATEQMTVNRLYDLVASGLAQSNRTLVLDEADQMKPAMFEMVRTLHDETSVPLILMGEETLPHQLEHSPRLHGRVLAWVGAAEATMADVDMLAKINARGIEIAGDLREDVLVASGHSHRYIATNLTLLRDLALAQGLVRVGRADWGARAFHTGTAPAPRHLPLHKQRPARIRRAA